MRRSVLIGHGSALPERIATNYDLEKIIDTSHDWIVARTGIHQRHLAADGEFTSHLAVRAGQAALKNAGIAPNEIDLIILATTTPDETMPSTATRVQGQLGMTRGAAFDVNAACSGFVYALHIANGMICSGQANKVLVIGAETYSRILDWKDRATCVLFGDGAGAFVLEGRNEPEQDGRGILFSRIYSDGRYGEILATSGGVSTTKDAGLLFMSGKEVFKHAVSKMADALGEGLAECGLSVADLDWVVPHQANWRIMRAIAEKLELPEEKVISTVKNHANTSAASIPLAFDVGVSDKKIKQSQLVAMPALGAGLTWGCCIIKI